MTMPFTLWYPTRPPNSSISVAQQRIRIPMTMERQLDSPCASIQAQRQLNGARPFKVSHGINSTTMWLRRLLWHQTAIRCSFTHSRSKTAGLRSLASLRWGHLMVASSKTLLSWSTAIKIKAITPFTHKAWSMWMPTEYSWPWCKLRQPCVTMEEFKTMPAFSM